jgi:uncharacterized protein (TIGR02646 family)
LLSQDVEDAQGAVRVAAARGKPTKELFKSHWGADDVRRALSEMQFKKCAYCERIRDHNRESDVEHFRPKAGVTEAAPSHKGYWRLAYEWKNLLFSCRHCNQQYKMNFFPLPNESRRASMEGDDLSKEDAYLIDPTSEPPEEYFAYDWSREKKRVWILAARGDERARVTIKTLSLNRTELLEERGFVIDALRPLAETMLLARREMNDRAIKEAAAGIRDMTEPNNTFAGLRRFYFRSMGLDQYIF